MADDPELVKKVKKIGGEDGIAAVINCASRSANILPQAVEMLRPGGTFVMVGYTPDSGIVCGGPRGFDGS